MVDITGLDKAAVLAALYNNSKPLGMGYRHFDPADMTTEQARAILEKQTNFDYLKGRVMKIEFIGNSLDEWDYDRDNGRGACERVVNNVRQMKEVAA
jgi:hypothetical protein